MRDFFDAIPWWKLRPAQQLLDAHSGDDSPERFVAAAMTEERNLAVIYTPHEGEIKVRMVHFASPMQAYWVRPHSGDWQQIGNYENVGVHSFHPPEAGDWVLVLRPQ